MTRPDYQQKFDQIVVNTNFDRLDQAEQSFLKAKAFEHGFTHQELRQVSDMALDRSRWKESPLHQDWPETIQMPDAKQAKKRTLAELRQRQDRLSTALKSYAEFDYADKPKTQKPLLDSLEKPGLGLGRCPVASEKTRCCNLMTLDAVEKCGFDCSYCSIQSFYHGNQVTFDSGFARKLKNLHLDPDKTYHIGTGQSSDSLMWGNHQGVLEALCDFAASHPNVILELKTKSRNIGWLLDNPVPRNVLCTWTLNPQTIIDSEEHLSASLSQRLDAARALADKGCVVGFHFHPIIYYQDWADEYANICAQLTDRFSAREVALVSMGTLTFTRSVMKTIRQRELFTKILQMPLESSAGKLSYPMDIKIKLFSQVYSALSDWHKEVFFYLCMEPQYLWPQIFGFDYASNDEFESAMKQAYLEKINHPHNQNQNREQPAHE